MRDFTQIVHKVADEYKMFLTDLNNSQCLHMAKIELFLCGLLELGLMDQDIADAWSLLYGYHQYNRKLICKLTEEQQELLSKLRGYMQLISGSNTFHRNLEIYLAYPKRIRLFEIEKQEKVMILRANAPALYTKRSETLKRALKEKVLFKSNKQEFLQKQVGYFYNGMLLEKVKFPSYAIERAHSIRQTILDRVSNISDIYVSKKEIIQTAQYMDTIISNRNYEERAKKIFFEVATNNNEFQEKTSFKLNEITNIVGRVGSGKSTLVEIFVTLLAKKGYKATIVVDSVFAILQYIKMFQELDIKTVPIWGYRNRQMHIEKGISHLKEKNFDDIKQCNYHQWLAEICVLDGLRGASDLYTPFVTGKEPCLNIIDDLKKEEKMQCPYYDICPSHKADNDLNKAVVYITTPAAFIKTKVSSVNWKENIRVSEFIYYMSDVVIFDEADRVQIQFDQSFAESLTLFDDTGKSYLNALAPKVESWHCTNRIDHARDSRVQKWYIEFRNTQRCCDLIIAAIKESKWLVNKLEGRYYTAYSLTDILENQMSKETKLQKRLQELRDYVGGILRNEDSKIYSLYHMMLSGQVSREELNLEIQRWWLQEDKNYDDNMIDCIKYIILSSGFEKGLKKVVNGLDEIEDLKELEIESIGTFYKAIKDYLPFIPTSPMGNIFGFRITVDERRELKSFIVFKATGMGRWLLTNYHRLYFALDKKIGPKVILLSGTSWAPNSYSYHLDIPVDILLKGTEDDFNAVAESEFMLDPILCEGEYISVSGTSEQIRINNLQKIVQGLFKCGNGFSSKKSKIEQELEKLEEDRKKILLLVGSYEEARKTKAYLDGFLRREGTIKNDEVMLLIRDQEESELAEEEVITRGQVAAFGTSNAKVLIAPLLALERGHNILNEDNRAAIGAVYFLIRPMPVPNDMNIILHMLSSNTIRKMNKTTHLNIYQYIEWVKTQRNYTMMRMQQLLINSQYIGYKQLSEEERTALCMTQFVTICQVVGRLVRGGCRARVHFCDAKFAPQSLKNEKDTSQTSLLVGIIKALAPYMEKDENEIESIIAKQLYYPFYKGLKECEGLRYE